MTTPEHIPNDDRFGHDRSNSDILDTSLTPSDASQAAAPSAHTPTADNQLAGHSMVGEGRETAETERGLLYETAKAFGGDLHEAKSLDRVVTAETTAEEHTARGKRTEDSPAHQAVWGKRLPLDGFFPESHQDMGPSAETVVRCLSTLTNLRDSGRLFGSDGKFSEAFFTEMGAVGYWGMLVPREYGGQGASMRAFAHLLREAAKIDPSAAGLCSIHGCIGAVDPLVAFGTEAQKRKFLPDLASGRRLSGFALTEPGAGSDLSAIKTNAVRVGDKFLVTGEKLFISNATFGRTVGLVCLIDKKPSVLIVDLPTEETDSFHFKNYPLKALRRIHNRGLVFNNFEVPAENLLDPSKGEGMRGDGLTIAYHGLNFGRLALCANAGGTMAGLLAGVLPFAKQRLTYNRPIAERQLVQRRLGSVASYIVGCEAISSWCANLLDKGYRGELECTVAKVFGSDAQIKASLDIMKTYGGRSFVGGNPFGDNIHDLLAPSIYEGENDMLSLGEFKSLTKAHTAKYFLPLMTAINDRKAAGKLAPDFKLNQLLSPSTLFGLLSLWRELAPLGKWTVGNELGALYERLFGVALSIPRNMPDELRKHVKFAARGLRRMELRINRSMVRHGEKLQQEQELIADLSQDFQKLTTIALTACWACEQKDGVLRKAAQLLCEGLSFEVTGEKPTHRYKKGLASLGRDVLKGDFRPTKGLKGEEIQLPYPGCGLPKDGEQAVPPL